MSGTARVRVDGEWLDTMAPVGSIEVIRGLHGTKSLSWSMALRNGRRPSVLTKRRALVQVYAGALLVGAGRLVQPDWNSGSFAAIGNARQGESVSCRTAGGAASSKPNTVIDAAIAAGKVDWVRGSTSFGNSDISGVPGDASNDDPNPGKLDELLDDAVLEMAAGTQWRIQPDGLMRIYVEDPTTPNWFVSGAGVLGVTDEAVCDQVNLRYRDSAAGKVRYVTYPASIPAGGITLEATVEKRGPMTAVRALAIATGIFHAAQGGRLGWTNGLEVTTRQISTTGGRPADLAKVDAGQTVRMRGLVDPRTGHGELSFVIEEVRWRPGSERVLTIIPRGMVGRSQEQILTDYRAEAA